MRARGGAPARYVGRIGVEPAASTATLSPSEEIPPLSDRELELLREVGWHWAAAIGARHSQLTALPVDPALRRVSRKPRPTRFGRIAPVEMFDRPRRDE